MPHLDLLWPLTLSNLFLSPYHRVYTSSWGFKWFMWAEKGEMGGIAVAVAVAHFCTHAMRFMHRTQSLSVRRRWVIADRKSAIPPHNFYAPDPRSTLVLPWLCVLWVSRHGGTVRQSPSQSVRSLCRLGQWQTSDIIRPTIGLPHISTQLRFSSTSSRPFRKLWRLHSRSRPI